MHSAGEGAAKGMMMRVQSAGGLKKRFAATLKEARLGVRDSQYDLGLMYANGIGVEKNLQQAIYWIEKAAERGLGSAQFLLGTRYAGGIGVEADAFVAQNWLQKAAAQQHPKAYLKLGILLRSQSTAISRRYLEQALALGATDAGFYLGVAAELEKDWVAATAHYLKAAQSGSSRAYYALGQLKLANHDDPGAAQIGMDFFRKAAKTNYPPALVALHDSDGFGRGRRMGKAGGEGRINAPERRRAVVDWSSTFEADDDIARFCLGRMFEEGISAPIRPLEALGWYRAAANLGYPPAFWALAQYAKRDGDVAEWEQWCRKAADSGITSAQSALGEYLLNAAKDDRGLIEAMRLLNAAATAADAVAAKNLAAAYLEHGDRCGYAAYLQAAQLGDPEAQCWVGLAHKDGAYGAKQDVTLAAHWLQASAKGGNVSAQSQFASLLMTGLGVRKSAAEAFKWYSIAAEQGDAVAQWNVGNFFLRGVGGVNKDLKSAYVWCRRAAQQGFSPAQASLGVLLLKIGKSEEAMEWLYQAAQNGDGEAQFNLYAQLEKFPDRTLHYGDALRWCFAAAESDVVAAQTRLAVRFANGVGVPEDRIEAHKWFFIASRAGNPAAIENLKRSAAAIGEMQIAEAVRRAQAWTVQKRQKSS